MEKIKALWLCVLSFTLAACSMVETPEGVRPVQNFNADAYLGKWYEIARFDHSFERGLERVTATYSMREDGGIDVINRGYNPGDDEWDEANGKAYFVENEDVGHLKVSFFGPFYASYVVAELDDDYQYALVTGPSTEYLWILSRTPQMSDETLDMLLAKAESLGFDTANFIFVEHDLKK